MLWILSPHTNGTNKNTNKAMTVYYNYSVIICYNFDVRWAAHSHMVLTSSKTADNALMYRNDEVVLQDTLDSTPILIISFPSM
jgi:hypothetical protein